MHELSFLEAIFPRAAGPVRKIVFAALVCCMKKAAVVLNVLFVFLSLGHAQTRAASPSAQPDPAQTKIMKVDDVRPGTKGIGYTVFQGTKPEPMGVEVLGVRARPYPCGQGDPRYTAEKRPPRVKVPDRYVRLASMTTRIAESG